ncbi:MAG: hypothetical protein JWP24_2203 [Marmoricola sp.]|nr:hypothetical protein [Marmoricola sp.]
MLALPWLVAHVLVFPRSFVVPFAFTAVALDAVLTSALVRRRAHRTATVTWVLGVPLLGALGYFRFDLLPAVLAAMPSSPWLHDPGWRRRSSQPRPRSSSGQP